MKLALDHHYSATIAVALRGKDHDVVAAVERGWERTADEDLLRLCWAERRALLTNNVVHFAPMARNWAVTGTPHAGLIFTADASRPRGRLNTGAFVRALDQLMRSLPDDDTLVDRIHWL